MPEISLNQLLADSIARAINQAAAGAPPERANELVRQALDAMAKPPVDQGDLRRRRRMDAYIGDGPEDEAMTSAWNMEG
jgi:hypothetical protein